MAWQADDVVRSARRYLMIVLAEFPGPGEPPRAWEVRLQPSNVADQGRPIGELATLPKSPGAGRTSVPQGNVTETLGLVFTGWPAIIDGARGVLEGGLRARRLASALDDLIRYGVDTVRFSGGRRAAGPQHLPLWDYTSVPIAGVSGPAYPHDVMWAETWSTHHLPDPSDDARYTVVLNLTVSWERPGRVAPGAPLVGQIPGTFQP